MTTPTPSTTPTAMATPKTTTSGGFAFISHHRRGLIALPGTVAGTFTAAAVLSDTTSSAPIPVALPSVADVQGIDPAQVTRQYPAPGATDVETEFFPLIEFAAPELPWMLPTPAATTTPTAGAGGPLPWLSLVVVQDRDGVTLTSRGQDLPDVLSIGGGAMPSEELPDPAQSALWAHAFAPATVSATGSQDPTVGGSPPGPTGSRLVAPRRLIPQTSYIACVVPTLAAAALAGLGHGDSEVAAALAAPQPNYAWSTSDQPVELPVYLHWEFTCGAGGDFETLARQLHELPLDASFGSRPLDLGLAGSGLPLTDSTTTFRGALTAPGLPAQPAWPDPGDAGQVAVDAGLATEIGQAAALTAQAVTELPAGRPVIGPLLYARAAAGRGDVNAASPAHDWFNELNRDPRNRAAAGLGSRVLRRNVESVMARAWEQVGQVNEANAVLARLQASRSVSGSIHRRHLSGLPAGRLFAMTRPLLGRVTLPAAVTGGTAAPDALAAVAASAMPAGATWRGLGVALQPGTRLGAAAATATPGAPSGTESGTAPTPGTGAPAGTPDTHANPHSRIVSTLAGGIAEPAGTPDGTLSLAAPSAVLGPQVGVLLTDTLRSVATTAGLTLPPSAADPAAIAAGIDAAAATAGHLTTTAATALAAQTSATVNQRPLPVTISFTPISGLLGGTLTLREQPIAASSAAAAAVDATAAAALPVAAPGPVATTGPVATGPVITTGTTVTLPSTDPRLAVIRGAYAAAVDRFIRADTSTALPTPAALDLAAAGTAILAGLRPAATIATLAVARVPGISTARPDPVAPVMAGPIFTEGAFGPLVDASHDAFMPGMDAIPGDSVTLLRTNPAFVTAYLAGLNSALGHELLWRGFPTDERGTYWHSFWGTGPDIPPLHRFTGDLAANMLPGNGSLLVLVLRGRLLRRYPDSDIYAVPASTDPTKPELDSANITRPVLRRFIAPDITLVGFDLTHDQVAGTNTTPGYWFVIAEHPGRPRFGLTDPGPAVTHPPLPTWDELSWADLGPAAATATYLPSAPASAPPMAPAGTTRHWGASAADMAAITYQPPVRVAIRARDLLADAPGKAPT